MDEEFRRNRIRTVEILEICCRCLILFTLDFILNGSFVTFLIRKSFKFYFEGDNPSIFEILFACDRTNLTDIWSRMPWTSYLIYSFVYFACLFTFICLFLVTTNQLLSFIEWVLPILLSLSSFVWVNNYEDPQSERNSLYYFYKTAGMASKLKYVYSCLFRVFYAVYAARLYRIFFKNNLDQNPTLDSLLKLHFTVPLMSVLGFGHVIHRIIPALSLSHLCVPLLLLEIWWISINVPGFYSKLLRTYRSCRQIVRDFGLQTFLTQHWNRLAAPQLLRTFWIGRFCFYAIFIMFAYWMEDELHIFHYKQPTENVTNETLSSSSFVLTSTESRSFVGDFIAAFRYLTIRSCETFVALLGTTGVVSSIGNFVGNLFEMFLQDVNDEERNAGSLTGILFLILCVQTNITGLSADKRIAKLYRNLWLLAMALMHFVHHSVNGLLTRLTTTGNFRANKHARALAVSLFLLVAPALFLVYAWPTAAEDMFNPWILSVAIFAVELMVKMIISLIIYALNVFDAKMLGYHSNMDDVVYYVSSFGAVLEFLFGVILFFDGLWILFFEQGGLLRAFMICVHAYCNIYLQAVEGWSKLRKRGMAAAKLASLKDATAEQIRRYNDVCCICYQDTTVGSTKITRCGHYFHGVCLRKWLYVQDKCPLCHNNVCSPLTKIASTTVHDDENL